MIMVEYVVGIIASVMLLISLEFKIYILFWLSIALFGMFIYSVLPGLIQFTCEQMHPLGEATVSGTSFGFGELFSFLMVKNDGYRDYYKYIYCKIKQNQALFIHGLLI